MATSSMGQWDEWGGSMVGKGSTCFAAQGLICGRVTGKVQGVEASKMQNRVRRWSRGSAQELNPALQGKTGVEDMPVSGLVVLARTFTGLELPSAAFLPAYQEGRVVHHASCSESPLYLRCGV